MSSIVVAKLSVFCSLPKDGERDEERDKERDEERDKERDKERDRGRDEEETREARLGKVLIRVVGPSSGLRTGVDR